MVYTATAAHEWTDEHHVSPEVFEDAIIDIDNGNSWE